MTKKKLLKMKVGARFPFEIWLVTKETALSHKPKITLSVFAAVKISYFSKVLGCLTF